MSDSLPGEQAGNLEASTRKVESPDKGLEKRLQNWANERRYLPERNARLSVVEAMRRDTQRSESEKSLSDEDITEKIKSQRTKIEERMSMLGVNSLSFTRLDESTGESFVTEVIKGDDGSWTTQEKNSDGNIISQFRIGPSGTTELTLHYLGNRYSRRNANPDLTASSAYQEATTVGFNLLAGEVVKNFPRNEVEQKRLDIKRQEVIEAVKEGRDQEGRMIYDAFKASLSDPERAIGDIAVTYQKAQTSRERLANIGELNKLLSSLDSLYKQVGESGYKPEIDVSGKLQGVIDEKERQRIVNEAIKEKAEQDLDNFADKFAEKRIEGYAEARAKFDIKEAEVTQALGKEDLDRTEIRQEIFEFTKAKAMLLREIGRDSRKIGNEMLGEDVKARLEGRWTYEENEPTVLSDEKRKELVENEKERYIQELFNDKEYRYGNIIADTFSPEESEQAFGNISEIDYQIAYWRSNLQKAAHANPTETCSIVSEIKHLQLQRKSEIAGVRVMLAEKRVGQDDARWAKVRGEMGDKISKFGLRGAREGGRRFIAEGRLWLASRTNRFREQFTKDVGEAIGRFGEFAGGTKDNAVALLQNLDKRFLGEMRETSLGVRERISGAILSVKERYLRVKNDFDRRSIVVNKALQNSRYEADMRLREKQADIFVNTRALKWQTQTALGGVIGGEVIRERNNERRQRINKVTNEDFQRRVMQIRAKENPYLEVFQKDLEKRRVVLIEKVQEEIPETGKPPESQVVESGRVIEVKEQAKEERISQLTNKELRDLRKDAGIRYRDDLQNWADSQTDQHRDALENSARLFYRTLREYNDRVDDRSEKYPDEGLKQRIRESEDIQEYNASLQRIFESYGQNPSFDNLLDSIRNFEQIFKDKWKKLEELSKGTK